MIKVRQVTQQRILKIIDELEIERGRTVKNIEHSRQKLQTIEEDLQDLRHIMEYLNSDEKLK